MWNKTVMRRVVSQGLEGTWGCADICIVVNVLVIPSQQKRKNRNELRVGNYSSVDFVIPLACNMFHLNVHWPATISVSPEHATAYIISQCLLFLSDISSWACCNMVSYFHTPLYVPLSLQLGGLKALEVIVFKGNLVAQIGNQMVFVETSSCFLLNGAFSPYCCGFWLKVSVVLHGHHSRCNSGLLAFKLHKLLLPSDQC